MELPPLVLALDAASPRVSVAIGRAGEVLAARDEAIARSSRRLLEMVDEALSEAGVEREASGDKLALAMLAPLDAPFSIRPARPHDLGRIAWLEEHCFPDPWPSSILAHELAHPRSFLLVASRPGAPVVAYVSFRQGVEEAELLRLAVEAPARCRGLGRALVEAGLERLGTAGIPTCFLEVRPDNQAALALYRGMGFSLTGRRTRYYRDGSDALVYTLHVSAKP